MPPSESPFYHFVLIRSDLPFGVQLAQTVHAAGQSSPGPGLPPDTHAVVLQASEAQIRALEGKLLARGIQYFLVREPDPPYNGALMALALPPQPRTPELKRLFSSFSLAGAPSKE